MSAKVRLGDDLLALAGSAVRRFHLVAPFMKAAATRRILDAVPERVRDVTLVTRWSAEEVASGVSDLEVYDLVAGRPGARLLLHPLLHGKLYMADDRIMVGSANATGRALGWHDKPNLELLLPYVPDARTDAFLDALFAGAGIATSAMRAAVAEAAERLKEAVPPRRAPWLPRYPSPYHLWHVYGGIEAPGMMSGGREDARADLSALGITDALDHGAFTLQVRDRFMAEPLVALIAKRLNQGLGDGAAELLLQAEVPYDHLPHGSAVTAWEILKRWFTTFGGDQFRIRSIGEELVRSPLI